MKTKSFILVLCLGVFLFSFSNKKETTQIGNDKSNIVKSLVQTTDYLKLQVNSPMKLAEYTANKNDKRSLIKSISKDIIFIPNKGQIIDTEGKLRPDILYKAELNGVDLYLTNKGMSFVFYKYEDIPKNLAAGNKGKDKLHDPFREEINDKIVKMYRMDLDVVGINTNFKTLNEEQTIEYFNYYYAHCPVGITNVHGYRKVIFENVYNNIDLVYYSNEKGLKYDFIVKPGGNVSDIKLKYKNEDEVYITEEGRIRAMNPFGESETDVLLTYQSDGKVIESNYKKDPDGTISINTTDYDKNKDLIIDPFIGATYYGGLGDDFGIEITVDGNNNILITGYTECLNFPLQSPSCDSAYFQYTYAGVRDAFILKMNSNGLRLWVTYYGGDYSDDGRAIATDGNDNILITGSSNSINMPVYNPGGNAYFQISSHGSNDIIILKFNSQGIRKWATYYGGWNSDYGSSVTTDDNNNIIVTGYTSSFNLLLYNPGGGAYFQGTIGGGVQQPYDAFILKFSPNGVRQWATFYGGYGEDRGYSITTDDNNNILMTGFTYSSDFPVYNPGTGAYFQGAYADSGDVFILKFSTNCAREWATYYGGSRYERGRSITVNENNIYVTGGTGSINFPLQNPGGGTYFQIENAGYGDVFFLKFDTNGFRQWSTYFGGSGSETATSIITDGDNNIIITGYTYSTDFPIYNPGGGAYFQSTNAGSYYDAFISKLNYNGTLQWSTYYGGSSRESGNSIMTNSTNSILVTGRTESYNFPVFNPGGGAYFQGSHGLGFYDAFILGFTPLGVITNFQNLNLSIPNCFKLYQNYPNPFNPTTNIKFDLRNSSNTKLIVYDILGKEIATLVNEKLSAGSYEVEWPASTGDASSYPSGVYLYKLITDEFVDVKKMLLIK